MNHTNPLVDHYFITGCMRCPLGNTPQCKVHTWEEQLRYLRKIILDCGLTEELKWSQPCYTYQGKNILIMAAFKEACFISFFKGVLLQDSHQILEFAGDHSQSAKLIRFTSLLEIMELKTVLKEYIFEAIEIEKAGLKVEFKKEDEYDIPEEFQRFLNDDLALKTAYDALTPGRKRGYLLYFSAPKQAKTREARIEKYIPKILKGLGFHD